MFVQSFEKRINEDKKKDFREKGEMQYLNLSNKKFGKPEEGWYNLETNRIIKKKKEKLVYYDECGIAGSDEMIQEFCRLNNYPVPQNLKEKEEKVQYLNEDIDEIEKISDDQFKGISTFSFERLFCKGKIDRVIDGDTVDLYIYLPLSQLAQGTLRREEKKVEFKSNLLLNQKTEVKCLFKLRCRLFGIDTADLNKEKKELGAEHLKKILDSYQGIIYCLFLGREYHGRELVEIYADSQRKINLCQEMLSYQDPKYGALAYEYFGGTKISH